MRLKNSATSAPLLPISSWQTIDTNSNQECMQERRSRLLDLSSALCQSHNPRHSLIVARISNRSTSAEHPSAHHHHYHHHKSKSSSTTRGLYFLRHETKRKEEYASLGHHQNAARPIWNLKTNRQKTQSYGSFFPRKTKPITLEARRSKTSLIGIPYISFFSFFAFFYYYY